MLTTLQGYSKYCIEKRQVAKDIMDSNSDLYKVSFFSMPNGNMYLHELYILHNRLLKKTTMLLEVISKGQLKQMIFF